MLISAIHAEIIQKQEAEYGRLLDNLMEAVIEQTIEDEPELGKHSRSLSESL